MSPPRPSPPAPARTLAVILPEGAGPPADVPPDVFSLALHNYLECRRLERGEMARTLGMSRATLWRRIGSRDRLLGALLWYRARLGVAAAHAAASGSTGIERVLQLNDYLLRRFNEQAPLRRLLDQEPEIALRVLTSKHGPVQPGLVAAQRRLLEEEQRFGLVLALPADVLSFAIVRLAEGFLYADQIAGHEPDVDRAMELVRGLVVGNVVAP
ncbi:MAG TPA: QsdR family transcriptional regulator [Solirubrobacteraceae bacterium]